MSKKITIVAIAFLGVALGFLSVSASAEDKKTDFTIGKKGEVHFNVPVRAGGTLLKPGMYQVQHAVEGNDHIIAFKAVSMPAGYRHGNTQVDKDVAARVKCTVEPVAQKTRNTKITLRINSAGEKEVADVQIAGEAFKHLM